MKIFYVEEQIYILTDTFEDQAEFIEQLEIKHEDHVQELEQHFKI